MIALLGALALKLLPLLGGGWEGVDHEQMRLLLVTPPWPSPRKGGEKTTLLKKGEHRTPPPLLKRDGTMFEFLPVGRK
ncbi:hypothetical protein DD565_01990 [Vibrio cholerae]|nr:hypothetical protein DD565_01990 [Vibrio cholerae]